MNYSYIDEEIRSRINLPEGISIRKFVESDFSEIQSLYQSEGWMTFVKRPQDGLTAWRNSPIALVAVEGDIIVGLVRGITDGEITTYIAEVIVDKNYRGKGIGDALISTCHYLYPHTRIDLLSTEGADEFYKRNNFRQTTGFRKSYY